MDITRRGFLQTAAVAAGTAMTAQAEDPKRIVRHAIIGTGGQGMNHLQGFMTVEGCEIAALCDVDLQRLNEAARTAPSAKTHGDFRHLLEDPAIDSVSIVTADHWHTPIALAALKAGKHVYVEKPCSHNIAEGTALLRAAEKTGLCVQHGTQSRTSPGVIAAIQFVREGGIGKVRLAKAINHQMRGPIGRAPESAPPEHANYDLWLGPAPERAFTKNRWHYNWHWMWDYGCGDLGNDGIHQVDIARWGLGAGWPKAVSASGGQLFYDDDHETPDTQVVTFEFDDCYLLYEMRLWTDYKLEGHDNGVVFFGDKGTVEVGREGCYAKLIGEEPRRLGDGIVWGPNLRLFIDAVRAKDPSMLTAPAGEAVISSGLCHLGNIATRVGRRLHFDADKLECTGDPGANALLSRNYRKGYELPVV